jgi:hypothetical protein
MPIYNNARECIAAIIARYRMLDSYVDEGYTRPSGSSGPDKCWFETQYARPDLFRFCFSRPHPYPPLRHLVTHVVIGSDGTTPYFRVERNGTVLINNVEESLGLAVAGATGISNGTAHTIGSLLFDSVGGFSLSMLGRPRFRRSREFGGEHCGRITGIHPRGGRVTVWFGTSDLLVRKIVRHRIRSEEIRKNICVDQPIDQVVFRVPRESHAPTPDLNRASTHPTKTAAPSRA